MEAPNTRVQLCGALSVVWSGRPVELPGRQGRMLFAFLVLNRPRPCRRDELVAAVWPEGTPPGASDTVLSPPLSRLRKVLGPDAVRGRSDLALVLPDGAVVDWEQARAARDQTRAALRGNDPASAVRAAREALEVTSLGLLPGLEAEWIDDFRRELTDIRVEMFEAVATSGVALGGVDLTEAEEAGRMAVDVAPFRESAHAALIDVLRARGNVAEALRVFDDLRIRLRDELGTAPGARLLELHKALLADTPAGGGAAAGASAAAAAAGPAPSRPAPAHDRSIIERDTELAALDRVLDRVRAGAGGVVLIEGPAGIGKSELLLETRRRAEAQALAVLTARGSELEREFPFGVVRQLFETVVADPARRERLLAGAAAPAGAVFGSPDNGSDGDASFAALHGLFWMTLNLTADGPVVLAVDDIQWCDLASLRFLAYLTRRLEGVPVTVAATMRTGEPAADAALMAEITDDPAVVAVRPQPLTDGGVRRLVVDRLGEGADAAFCDAVADVTGGNPLLVEQLVAALAADGVQPIAESVGTVRDIGPRAVSRSVLTRLARLTGETVAVARAIAVLGDSAELPAVAALAELDERAAATATSSLARAELLRPTAPYGFIHPLVREAVYHDLPHAERELQHAQAARVLADLGAPADEVSTHLLAIPRRGQEWIARTLHDAGLSARGRGAAASAVTYLRRALEEPPPADLRPRLLFDLGSAEGLTDAGAAIEHLRAAYEAASDPVERARAAEAAGRTMIFPELAPEATGAFLRGAIAEIGETDDPELIDARDALIAARQVVWFFGSRDPEVEEQMITGRHEQFGDSPGALMRSVMVAAYWTFAGGGVDECCDRALAALEGGRLTERADGLYAIIASFVLGAAVRDDAVETYDRLLAEAHRRGSVWLLLSVGMWRGWTMVLRGDLDEAETSLRYATDGGRSWGIGDGMPGPDSVTARLLLARGDLDAARQILSKEIPANPSQNTQLWLCARGDLLLEEGDHEGALACADRAGAGLQRQNNPAFAPWRSLRARALAALGRHDEAIAAAEEELAHARAWGAPGVVGRSLRIVAELSDDEAGLREAIELLEGSNARLEHARALAALGSHLRRARRPSDAREPLREALELADRCGASGLAEHVRAELYATGARPRTEALTGVASLTASERRVAALAVGGRTNRDIAQALFVTPKTVEVHLSNTYRKLGIKSRRELPAALGDSAEAAAELAR